MFAWWFGSLNDHAYGPAVGRSLMLWMLMTSCFSGSFEEAAWKKGIAMIVIRFGSARTSVILSVRPLALTPETLLALPALYLAAPTMLTALGSLANGPPGEPRSLFSERLMA